MEPSIPASEQEMIDQARRTAASALATYLASKYGDDADGADILANDEETNMFVREGSEVRQGETARYTGYFLARVVMDGREIDVRYAPDGSTRLYALGGADNGQTQVLQDDMATALALVLPSSVEVTVQMGSLLPLRDWLLDEPYDGKDWFSPVPPDGFCYVQAKIPRGCAELSAVRDALSNFFGSLDAKGVYVCANIMEGEPLAAFSLRDPSEGGDQADGFPGTSLTWENSEWDPSAVEQRLMGSQGR